MADDKPQLVTFSEAEAQEIIDSLGITTCSICDEPITAATLGGALLVDGEAIAAHSSLSCLLEFMDKTQA